MAERAAALREDGRRKLRDAQYEAAAKDFSDALTIMVELHGQMAPECADLYYYHGRALTLHVANSASLFDGPATAADGADGEAKDDDDDDEEVEDEGKEDVQGAGAGEAAATAQQTLAAPGDGDRTHADKAEKGEGDDDDDDDDDDNVQVDDKQIAWENLEMARLILSSAQDVPSMERLADVYGTLADLAIESETFDVAVREYVTCLQLQQRLYEPTSRLIAETYPPLAWRVPGSKNFKLALALEASRKFLEAVRLIDEATLGIRKRLAWLATVKAQLEGAPRDKGKGRATDDDVDSGSANGNGGTSGSGNDAVRLAGIVPEVPPATVEEATVEIEDLEGLLASLNDKAEDLRSEAASSDQSLKALADLQGRGPVTTTGFGASAPAAVGASTTTVGFGAASTSAPAGFGAASGSSTTTVGFGAAAAAAAASASAPEQAAAVHDLSNLVRKRKPAAAADDEAAKRPKA